MLRYNSAKFRRKKNDLQSKEYRNVYASDNEEREASLTRKNIYLRNCCDAIGLFT